MTMVLSENANLAYGWMRRLVAGEIDTDNNPEDGMVSATGLTIPQYREAMKELVRNGILHVEADEEHVRFTLLPEMPVN